ncbi:MAG: DSD1 family PLP-dependent enzyme [Vicinamibacterales bacterium]|jgi:D-serine deaminase-like pyridoxal phosphate-dependent protein|nr:hypothetical protein [Acidobacteriota bacterium]MDP6372771.1 DSD1 family PLP-dependent enzyme [Vicinamibacterales bacterium]MDP6608879.1 DSD1 family PLP-dependent enzyme [Vicinamibacterales bacterium]HAK54671.1 hypothetical protein [Acidobacteriota bacterium]|tara:strand:+ start:650 stop:1861 length:1212 start_codon:yes stop_codon:yes gene_type:complete
MSISRRAFLGSSIGAVAITGAAPLQAGQRHRRIPLPDPMRLWDLATPALVADVDHLEANLRTMRDAYAGGATSLRPHAKTHKCPVIARQQLDLGAVGIAVAKISEAEVMVEAGIEPLLITSPIATRGKLARLLGLARQAPTLQIVTDRLQNVRDLSDGASAVGITLGVVVDLNAGDDRTGIALGDQAVTLARAVAGADGLELVGVQAYAGRLQHVVGWEARRQQYTETMSEVMETVGAIRRAGLDVHVVTGGGTGTYDIDREIDGMTDSQAGSYIFMDDNYRDIGGRGGPVFDDFEPSLYVLATAISQPVDGRITVDAGYKAFATDKEPPRLRDIEGVTYRFGGDEHGILELSSPSEPIAVGDKVRLTIPHCDPTVNLYDHLHAARGEQVSEVWPIAGRGRSQ